ncbi:MBL fold metallo-hydrolase [uncultured Roseobacter sp.]|uniref:MBL fold metallo-hydrolase n=1 Tax=uncultured Roseobacter sp. TaxID=114847 RepID=UPI0026318822|nr:MBL fold metallo-hydrolase [uncultured Roseobacter sp.]
MTAPVYHFIRNATARLAYGGKTFLLDPMLSDKGALPSFAGIAPNPTVDLPIPAAQVIAEVDVVIVSHLHGDHFDGAAAEMLDKSMPIITPRNGASPNPREGAPDVPFKDSLEAKGFTNVREIGSADADHITLDGITIHQVFARHGKGLVGDAMGGVNGLIFEAEGQPTIYWAGDTILDEAGEVEAVLKRFKPDVVIAHTGGPVVEALSPEILLMDAAQAATFFDYALRENEDVQIIAIHMDALDHCFSTRVDLASVLRQQGIELQNHVVVPDDGELVALCNGATAGR